MSAWFSSKGAVGRVPADNSMLLQLPAATAACSRMLSCKRGCEDVCAPDLSVKIRMLSQWICATTDIYIIKGLIKRDSCEPQLVTTGCCGAWADNHGAPPLFFTRVLPYRATLHNSTSLGVRRDFSGFELQFDVTKVHFHKYHRPYYTSRDTYRYQMAYQVGFIINASCAEHEGGAAHLLLDSDEVFYMCLWSSNNECGAQRLPETSTCGCIQEEVEQAHACAQGSDA